MRIAILGTGQLAGALGTAWEAGGHEVVITGRSPYKSAALASRLGRSVSAATPEAAVVGQDAVVLAVPWSGVADMLALVGAQDGALAGMPLVDPTNAVEHGVGDLLVPPGESAAERIAVAAPGASVVKAFHLRPAEHWLAVERSEPVTVPMCGDDPAALAVVGELVRAVGAVPVVLGPLRRARQIEEVAGFVIGLAFGGYEPRHVFP